MTLHFNRVGRKDIAWFLDTHHYIGDRMADPSHVFVWRESGGLFGEDGDIVATAVFAQPISKSWKNSLELVRLARAENVTEPLTKFLSKCIRYLKNHTSYDFAISYADPSAGHHGGIYQANNWIYLGPSSGKVQYVNKLTGRTLSQRSFDQSSQDPQNYIKKKTAAKFTYIYPLKKSTRRKWEAKSLPYPKPNK